jgi:hypothetical protein
MPKTRMQDHRNEQRMKTKRNKCAACRKRITGGSAYLSFGAVIDLFILKKKKLTDGIMEGFCHVGYHGADTDMRDSADYSVAENVIGGQMDIDFCSLDCLRKWFCGIVDYLERESKRDAASFSVRGKQKGVRESAG